MDILNKKKDFDYFAYFEVCANFACQEADYLHELMRSYDVLSVSEYLEAMHKIENDADMHKHEMLRQLAHEFMTPIEREDIVSLAQQLDEVVDVIEDVIRQVYMFNIQKIRPEVLDFTTLIVKACQFLLSTVKEFKHFKKSKTITDFVIAVNSIESEGDKLLLDCMHSLFKEESNPRELFIWKHMFDCLELCLDACEDASDIIEEVVMKNT